MNDLPEIPHLFSVPLYKDFRGRGTGTDVRNACVAWGKKVSLSVQKENYAYRLYLKVRVTIVDENDEE